MNLILDIGNTYCKLAVFENTKLIVQKRFLAGELLARLTDFLKKNTGITHGIVSSVAKIPPKSIALLEKSLKLIQLTSKTPIPFDNKYKTPSSLGIDRIALMAKAASYPTQGAKLVIDAGTCITFDFLTEKNAYLGGAISPGLQMRYKAMHTFTEKLPLLKTEDVKLPVSLIGNTTVACMDSGVVCGASLEIDAYIDRIKKKYKDLTVILTGGDSLLLSKNLKNSIFVHPNFLLEGLDTILEFNKD
ncbi:MAG: type III pantothenate kinase [Mesonia hippocampi]|uniref:type III pantothenate kinase n=1 Tax=Mesonia hippocampi TaxID=1628250 RepID=UPI003F9D2754